MGTIMQQQVYGIGGSFCADLAAREVARLEGLWSVFRPNSELSRLARVAGAKSIDLAPETASLLTQATALHASTEGALDITAGPLVNLWRLAATRGKLPSQTELEEARSLVCQADLEVSSSSQARLRRAGQSLDLGAIGKGCAADRCMALYRQHGIRHALIDLGGNVAVVGGKPDGTPWRVGLQKPGKKRGEYFGYIEARDCSIVTSGSYERGYNIDGARYSHIIDPRTGLPIDNDILSVTVMHRSSLLADAFATACAVLGAERGLKLARSLQLDVLVLSVDGETLTEGMARVYRSVDRA